MNLTKLWLWSPVIRNSGLGHHIMCRCLCSSSYSSDSYSYSLLFGYRGTRPKTGTESGFLMSTMASSSSSPSTSTAVSRKQNTQFYRRPLPETCIDFASDEGRALFKEAMNAGHMDCFFKLSSQFRTQDEPAYCGLTSLVMALNVLEIDPGRVWKGPWRWYHEEMLDCCISLDIVKQKGINIEQFVCIAKCNNLSAAYLSGAHFQSADELRALIKEKTKVDHQVLIVSYSRATLGQTGSGHFSPIAGYHEGKDLVLILDTARFKYPPHWIPLTSLLVAMNEKDPDTGLPRGLVTLSKVDEYVGTLLYRPSCSFLISVEKGTMLPAVWNFSGAWNAWLDGKQDLNNGEPQRSELIQYFVKTIMDHFHDEQLLCLVTQTNVQAKCDSLCCVMKCKNVSPEEEEEIRAMYINLIDQLESLKTFEIMKEFLSTLSKDDRIRLMKLVACSEFSCSDQTAKNNEDENVKGESCHYSACPKGSGTFVSPNSSGREWSVSIKITPENILTILFLMWPVSKKGGGLNSGRCYEEGSRREWMNKFLIEDLRGHPRQTIRQEVLSLNVKVVAVLNYHSNDPSKAFVPIKGFI